MHARLAATLLLLLAGCGGAAAAPPATADTTSRADGAINIGEHEWVRMELPEGALSVELPGEPHRRVATRDASSTYEVMSNYGPLELLVAVEPFTSVLSDGRVESGLDAVANLFAERARGLGCTPQGAVPLEVAARPGRSILSTQCAQLDGGTLAVTTFPQGSVLVSVVVAGRGVSARALGVVFDRLFESLVLGPPRSWFSPVDTPITAPNLPGFTASLTRDVHSNIVELDTGSVVARFTSEPLPGMATIAIVTTPATHTAREYCRGMESGGHLELTQVRDHFEPSATVGYCEVRGRRAEAPDVYEIHDIYVTPAAVIQLSWTGPNEPHFLAGGDTQLAAMRASMQLP